MSNLQKYEKCCEVFFIKTFVYSFVCCLCKRKYDNFLEFRNHNEIFHHGDVQTQEPTESTQKYEKIFIEKYNPDDSSSSSIDCKDKDNSDTSILNDNLEVEDIGKCNVDLTEQDIPSILGNSWDKDDEYFDNEQNTDAESLIEYTEFPSGNEFDKFANSEVESEKFEQSTPALYKTSFKAYANKRTICPFCNFAFKSFQKHDQIKCQEVQKVIEKHANDYETLRELGIYCCEDCPRYFETSSKLCFHRRAHYNSGVCQFCNKFFSRLEIHMKSQHPGKDYDKLKKSKDESKKHENYECSFCGKQFKTIKYLRRHEQCHKNNTLNCQFCGKCFKRPLYLTNHIRIHTGERPFKCSQCSAAFALKRNLDTHFIYKHTKEKPFQCNYNGGCGKSFKTEQLRFYHEQLHNPNIEFQCEICGKGFNVKSKLKVHYKDQHLDYNDRPHQCRFCDKKFVKKGRLLEHERTHTGEKPFKCNQCTRCFAKRNGLVEHKKLHSGEKKHICKICGKAFAQLAGYSNHIKNHA